MTKYPLLLRIISLAILITFFATNNSWASIVMTGYSTPPNPYLCMKELPQFEHYGVKYIEGKEGNVIFYDSEIVRLYLALSVSYPKSILVDINSVIPVAHYNEDLTKLLGVDFYNIHSYDPPLVVHWDRTDKSWSAIDKDENGLFSVLNSNGQTIASDTEKFNSIAFAMGDNKFDVINKVIEQREKTNNPLHNFIAVGKVSWTSPVGIIFEIVGLAVIFGFGDMALSWISESKNSGIKSKYFKYVRQAESCMKNRSFFCMENNIQLAIKLIKDNSDIINEVTPFIDPNEYPTRAYAIDQAEDEFSRSEEFYVCKINSIRYEAYDKGLLNLALDEAISIAEHDSKKLDVLRDYFTGIDNYFEGKMICPNVPDDFIYEEEFLSLRAKFYAELGKVPPRS